MLYYPSATEALTLLEWQARLDAYWAAEAGHGEDEAEPDDAT